MNDNNEETVIYYMDLDLVALTNQILLIVLKIFGLTTIPWFFIFSPFYIWLIFGIFSFLFFKKI